MHTPYTPNPTQAFLVAESALGAVGLALAAVHRRALGWAAWLFAAAFVLGAGASALPLVLGLHEKAALGAQSTVVAIATVVALAGALVARGSVGSKVAAIALVFALRFADGYFLESANELASLHLAVTFLVMGLAARRTASALPTHGANDDRVEAVQEAALFLAAAVLAALVGKYVLANGYDSSDEAAYVFQAHVFAKLRAYGDAAPCGESFRSYWVFDWHGRRFAQYTPGWPLFMVPFVWLRMLPLAGPTSLGLFAVGAARVARRLVAPHARTVAGAVAGASVVLSATCLINGGSYFSHVWVGACFLWSIEALLRMGEVEGRARIGWGIAFGLALTWMGATRPSDGLLLGSGVLLLFLYRLRTGRIARPAAGAAAAAALVLGGWTLWVLHQQTGEWLTTGYALASKIHPWLHVGLARPHADQWRWGIPLATGAYCWFPAAPGVALFGFALVRGREGRVLVAALALSVVALFAFYTWLDFGRGHDWGYGPRYVLPSVAAWSVGTGAAIAHAARARSGPARRAPALVAWSAASVTGALALAPLLYPMNTTSVAKLEEVAHRSRDLGLAHAVVLVGEGVGERGPLDYTKNLPLDLYPDQPVLVAQPQDEAEEACLRATFGDRSFWEAKGNPVRLEPVE